MSLIIYSFIFIFNFNLKKVSLFVCLLITCLFTLPIKKSNQFNYEYLFSNKIFTFHTIFFLK